MRSTPYIFLFVFLLFWISFVQAQHHAPVGGPGMTGTLSGIIQDSISHTPIGFAAVGVLKHGTTDIVGGGLADENGQFSIPAIPFGLVDVEINFIGFQPRRIERIDISKERSDIQLGTIFISPTPQLLEEIKVVGEAALIEAKPDKIVYNAEQDVTSRGGDAADVLRKVPLLTVDFDGNVSMRGSENVQILINGRPSGMFSDNVADALKMMPADQIKSVEVITSPSARFDGEGTAGIINIITKKKDIKGLAGSVDLTGGTRSNRGNLNLNYGAGKFGLNVSGGGHYNWPQTGRTSLFREENIPGYYSLLQQSGSSRSSRLGFRTQIGAEYKINEFHSLESSVSFRGHDSHNDNVVEAAFIEGQTIIDEYDRVIDGFSSRKGLDWETEYKMTFPRKDQELAFSFELDRDFGKSESYYQQTYFIPAESGLVRESNLNRGNNEEYVAEMDYVHPFSEAIKIETGGKATLRSIESDFDFDTFDEDAMQWVRNPERSDIFYYDQNVYAGYLSGTFHLGARTTLIAGARYEYTDLKGAFDVFEETFTNDYANWLPNVTLARKTGEFNQIKLSYNQRIQRPGQRHVNPFVEYNDNRDISFGNPYLAPELVHQLEFGTNIFIKGNMLSVSVFGRRVEDLIESLLLINPEGISETSFANFGRRHSLGLNVFGNLNLGNVSIRGGFDVNAWEVSGTLNNQSLQNTGYDYNGRLNVTWTISETLRAEGFSFFRSPSFTVQGKNPNWTFMSFGIKKEMLRRRLSLGINIAEPFRENQRFEREIEGNGFYQNSTTLRPVRSFGISVGYRFGKIEFNDREHGGGRDRQPGNQSDIKEVQSNDRQE